MAATARLNGVSHDTAGDTTTGSLRIMQLIWNGSTTVGDDLSCKNGAGTVMLSVKSNGSGFQPIAWPFGKLTISGLETDVLDAGTVEYIYA